MKEGEKMFVKASGLLLKDLRKNYGYACCAFKPIQDALSRIAAYPAARESHLNTLILDHMIQEESFGEPSIESAMHAVFNSPYVIHTHSIYANVFTCMEKGEQLLKNILSDVPFLFMPYANPGFFLAHILHTHFKREKNIPSIIFLKNHGLITHGNDAQETLHTHLVVHDTLKNYLAEQEIPLFTVTNEKADFSRHLFPDSAVYSQMNINEISPRKQNTFYEISSAARYIPKTIQYLKEKPVFISDDDVIYIQNMEKEKLRLTMMY